MSIPDHPGWAGASDRWRASTAETLCGSSDDSRRTLQRLKLCCMYIKLFSKLVDAPPPVCRWTDCSSSPWGDRPSSALLCCFNYPSAAQRRLPDGVTSAQFCAACAVVSVWASWKEAGPDAARGRGSGSAVGAQKHQHAVVLQREMSFSAVPVLPGAATVWDTTSLFIIYRMSRCR